MGLSRRGFLRAGLGAAAAAALAPRSLVAQSAETAPDLAALFPDLRRRFVFEYYPWYGVGPYRHWDQWDRVPPLDVASYYVPFLGAYDSRSPLVLERHARWIAESGAGAINVSWWGRGSYEDAIVPLLMDVMKDHDLRVTFHLEPYSPDHGRRFADDVLYLLREYGEKRAYDALLLLDGARPAGSSTARRPSPVPVFKGFRMIVPEEKVDCHGVARPEWDYTPDDEWRRQTDRVRDALRSEFPGVLLLADTVDCIRARQGGFDGIAVYDNYVRPESYAAHAARATEQGLLFSFNANPGFDGIERRTLPPDGCPEPLAFEPEAVPPLDWSRPADHERAARLSQRRVLESLEASLEAQTDPALADAQRGFLLVYLNSFNEWHEGTSFEPMADAAGVTAAERRHGYHNPSWGGYRLETLRRALAAVGARDPSARPALEA